MEDLLNVDNDDWSIVDGVLKDCLIYDSTNIIIPDGVVEISDYSITGNYDVVSIHIPKSVKLIRNGAFNSDDNLKDIYIENPNVVLECGVFLGLKALENVYIGGTRINVIVTQGVINGREYYCLEKYLGSDETYVIDNDIAEIGERAFYKNTKLKKVIIPSSVERILEEAFCGCCNLAEVEIAPHVYSIWERAFADCVSIMQLKLPSTVWSIFHEAFDGWKKEQTIFLSKDVKKMSKRNKWDKGCKAKIKFY